jgi:RecA-family ATPase
MSELKKPQTYNGDLDKLPGALAHLRDKPIWLCWKWEKRKSKEGGEKWTKPPLRVDDPAEKASSNDPATWGSHADAVEQVRAGKADGIGFALQGQGLACFDLDHCRDPETSDIDLWAYEYLDQFPDAYIEATVSGKGLRIIGTSDKSIQRRFPLPDQDNGAAIELFSNAARYVTLSCNEYGVCFALPEIGDAMEAIAAKLSGNGKDTEPGDLPAVTDAPPVAPESPITPWSFAEETRLRSALNTIPTDDKVLAEKLGDSHATWVKIGMAIERLDWGEKGYAIWRGWSEQNAKEFDEKGLRTQWGSFRRNRNTRANPVTVATVYHYAQQFGWRAIDTVVEKGFEKAPTPAPLPWINMSNWDDEPVPEREWAILNRVPLRQVGLVSGEGGTGKSIIELTKDVAHVAGKDWYGSMPAVGPAIYVGAEDDENEIHIRLAAIAKHYGVTFKELIDGGLHPLCLLGQDATLCAATGKGGKVEVTGLYRQLYEAAGDIKPKNISIDTLSRAFAGSEIDRVQVYAFAMHMQALATVAGGSVTVLSHPSLQGIASGSGLSGSTAWQGAFRFRQYLKGVKPDGGEQPDHDLRELEFKKNQYGPISDAITLRYQNGLFLPLPGTSFAQAVRESQADEVFLDLLQRFSKQNRFVSDKTSANYAPALFAKEDTAKAAGLSSQILASAMRRLFASGRIWNEPCGKPSRPQYRIAIKS